MVFRRRLAGAVVVVVTNVAVVVVVVVRGDGIAIEGIVVRGELQESLMRLVAVRSLLQLLLLLLAEHRSRLEAAT